MRFNDDLNVWQCANKRFLQTVASEYIISNKVLNFAILIATILFLTSDGMTSNIGKVVSLVALATAIFRRANYLGFYAGYEQGHADTIENPNNIHSFTDTESQLYFQSKESKGLNKNIGLFGMKHM